ncbi:MAG: efflux RND transporter periplasmic adaptor subunit [candidate division Zixibacteria bacterium]|nr:efflux RND transporter periplasmic adaptor subunit [candidate division Zixibacteria bacterium]
MTRHYHPRVVIAAVGLLLVSCSDPKQTEQSERVLAVRADIVHSRTLEMGQTYTGSLEGERQAVLFAKLAESVDSLWVKEDDRVQANEVILSLDKTGPSSKYREARSTFLNAEKNYNKMKFLFEQGAVSELEFDNAGLAYEVARADFDAVTQLVEIRTPIAGVVTAIDVRPGHQVTVGTRLATVATTNRLRVRFAVNPEEIGTFESGAKVKVTADGVSESAVGSVVAVASSADPVTRMFQVEALIDNPKGSFRPGMFVRIQYVRDLLADVVAVPRRAVIQLDGQPTVFVVVDGRAERRTVELGSEIDGLVIISRGVSVGDTLVTLGQDYLEDSVKVSISELNE